MPYVLLERLRCARLPARIVDDSEIGKLEILRTAGLVEADLPPTHQVRGSQSYTGNAIVMRVTPSGHVAAKARSGER
ncbi:hypothetical protein [Variovorax sp. dw_308]|uniref:hypothetical protein n=1 Tax=Variovorax sp. dw_308 TaxID=2721546 RepID=UPI001C4646BC|nr:hypothetical protein [Variovorax sp. dw_308]